MPVDILAALRGVGVEAESVNFIGWKGIQNGELMRRASQEFDLLLRATKTLRTKPQAVR